MADTIRTRADLQTLLADNTTGDISPQDHRDVLVSVLGVFGQLYSHDSVAGLTVGTSPVTVEWATAGLYDGITLDAANEKMTLAAGHDGTYEVHVQMSFTASQATYEVHVYKNAVEQTHLADKFKVTDAGDIHSCSIHGFIELVSTDDVLVKIEADGAAKTFTMAHGQFCIKRVK